MACLCLGRNGSVASYALGSGPFIVAIDDDDDDIVEIVEMELPRW
jgi:hypothetical protein